MEGLEKIMDSLSLNERKIIPYLNIGVAEICKRSNLDMVSVLRALEYLQNKGIVKLNVKKRNIINLGVNGALYKKKGLPERRFLLVLGQKRMLPLSTAQKEIGLSGNEFKASLGALKKKALIELKKGKIILNATLEEISKKSLEENFLENLPLNESKLGPEEQYALKSLLKRKDIVRLEEHKVTEVEITSLGKEIMNSEELNKELIEQITPELLKNKNNWKGKKFRRYDIYGIVPRINGGKRHFVNSAIENARKIWTEMGFVEMKGNMTQSSFWNFDALFTAQDHPVREMQDTFFVNKKIELPNKKLVEAVKLSHEKGIDGSLGWRYVWNAEEAKKVVLRTHTTCLSAKTLSEIKKTDLPKKYFSIGKCFRNETVDWNHGFEFNQSEGIVVDDKVNFRHLLGYLKQFAKKMGYDKIRFRPAYFPYTEPSLEGDVWDEERQEWVELLAAGIFRPEVTKPLFGKPVRVLAWGPGFDRMIMKIYEVKDLRELYKNNLTQLRDMKVWMKN